MVWSSCVFLADFSPCRF